METKRLFIAVEVPQQLRRRIYEFALQLRQDGIKLVEEENLHITLKFLGDIPAQKIPEIIEKLKRISISPFGCALRGVGVFPNPNYVRVVWVGVEGERLAELAGAVANELRGIGKEEDRPFSSHLTIARAKKKIDLRDFLEKNGNKEFGDYRVDAFSLFESTLAKQGPVYNKLASFRL